MKIKKENGANGVEKSSTNPDLAVPSLAQTLLGYAPDIARLKSALVYLPPSSNVNEITFHFIAPMVKAALEFPEAEGQIQELASAWACGELHDGKFPGLMAISRQGLSGKALFSELWMRLITDKSYKGPRRSLGSIYHVAKEAGWSYL